MEEDTRKLLEECNSGCKMAVSSMEQIQDYVTNKELDQVIAKSKENHQKLEAESTKMLKELGEEQKEPGMMVTAFSWFTTEVKMLMKDDNAQIAKIMMNGCNMGIQSISETMNKYDKASKESKALAEKLVKEEENFMKELKGYL